MIDYTELKNIQLNELRSKNNFCKKTLQKNIA